jgi:hypothetical protein
MGYYSGIIEHDTGIHADAEQQATGQLMMKVEITLAEYRELLSIKATSEFKLNEQKEFLKSSNQKLYDALKVLDADNKLTAEQKADFQKLCGDYFIKK